MLWMSKLMRWLLKTEIPFLDVELTGYIADCWDLQQRTNVTERFVGYVLFTWMLSILLISRRKLASHYCTLQFKHSYYRSSSALFPSSPEPSAIVEF